MIFVKPRHKPVFEMSVVRKICNFAELNFFNSLNERAKDFALSLETTCRVNELNQKIIIKPDNSEFELQRAKLKYDPESMLEKLGKFLKTLENFNSKIIVYNSTNDLKLTKSGNYLIFSQGRQVPNLDFCHAFFAIESSVKLEIGLNKFQETNSGEQILIGAVML